MKTKVTAGLVALVMIVAVVMGAVQAQGIMLQAGDVVEGTLSADRTVELWQFYAPDGAQIEIVMRALSGDLDPFLVLDDPAGRLVADNDNIRDNRTTTARIRLTLTSEGAYTIRAQAAVAGQAGRYELTFNRRDNVQPLAWDEARTYYETLDLSAPEAAVRTFVKAFQRDDFQTVWQVLAPRAQFVWMQLVNLLRYDQLYNTDLRAEVEPRITTLAEGIGAGEQSEASTMWFFDDMMLAATQAGALLIDLHGEVTILGSGPAPAAAQDPDSPDIVMDVRATVDGIQGTVIFRTVQAPSGRWRVLQVIVPGGDEEWRPWSVPSGN